MALSDVLDSLACPVCGAPIALHDRVVRCETGHAFDVAREGYVNLLPGRAKASTADTSAMVRARHEFLDTGAYAPIAALVAETTTHALSGAAAGVIADAGAGTGAYLAAALEANPTRFGVALDISKHAARVAARAHERIGSVVTDVWKHLPLRDGSTAVVLCIFSPRNAEEFARVLAPGGVLIVVTPAENHLAELTEPLGLLMVDPLKAERLSVKLSPHFEQLSEEHLTYRLALTRSQALAAALMGPIAAHVPADELARRAESLSDPVDVTVDVAVGAYRALPYA